ncbi:MAG TPA: SgcJ/EcaC family oxidoreductase [Gemmataceae bacterium]|nr:SgcJ/EcaC family oxidoreductase [Gemmataceae bacterium]
MKKQSFFALTCGLAAALAFGLIIGADKMRAQPDEPKAGEAPKEGDRTKEFVAAFNRGDAKALAGFWAPDGTYVDQDGVEVKGRDALEKMYENLCAEMKGAKLAITVTSTRTLAPTVTIQEGLSEVKPADGGPPSLANFSAVLVKKDDVWYLESLRESGVAPPSNAERFADLDWLIGDWVGENEKGVSATDSFDWAENRNFIVSSFTTTMNGVPVSGGTRWIAWDAAAKQIRSWSFYSGGGFSEGTWTKNGNSWTIQTTGTTAAGKKVVAANIVTKIDADHAIWQPTKVSVDDQALPNPAPVRLKRVKENEQPAP